VGFVGPSISLARHTVHGYFALGYAGSVVATRLAPQPRFSYSARDLFDEPRTAADATLPRDTIRRNALAILEDGIAVPFPR
jgi:hypothetical protein